MTTESSPATKAKARPLSGAILGVILGLSAAVVLQQQGVWPLDKISTFLLPALVGLIGILATSLGRQAATASMVGALVLTLGLGAWGATGLADAGDRGELNGGCTVNAVSADDTTVVTDTSSSDPFRIDPDGGLSWEAGSPTVFQDYEWEIWADVGGFHVIIDEGFEENDDESQTNTGSVANVRTEAEDLGLPMDRFSGVFKVGGFAATCDGFAFISFEAGPLESMVAKVAAGIGLLALIGLIAVAATGRGKKGAAVTAAAAGGTSLAESETSAEASGADEGLNLATEPTGWGTPVPPPQADPKTTADLDDLPEPEDIP